MDKLLRELGISMDLGYDEILEKLKEANTEYLERIENCSDPKRLADLQDTQERIEQALHDLSTGVADIPKPTVMPAAKPATASVNTAKPQTAAPSPQKKTVSTPKDPYAEASEAMRNGDYAGVIAMLTPYANKKDLDALLICGKCYEMLHRNDEAKKMYTYAAQAGDKTAALRMAKWYADEKNYDAALKMGRKAYDPANADSVAILANIYANQKNYIEAYRCFRKHMYLNTGYEQHEIREKMKFYLNLLLDNAGTQSKVNRLANKLRRESKDKEERSMLKDAKRICRPGICEVRFSIDPGKIFDGIKILFSLAVLGFLLYLAGGFIHYVIIGWAYPTETEGGYSVYISDKGAAKIPSKYFFSPVVSATTSEVAKVYVPESLESLYCTNDKYYIGLLTVVGDKSSEGGVLVPETLRELILRYSKDESDRQPQRFDFSHAKELEVLRVRGFIMSGTLNLSELPLLSSIEFSNVNVKNPLTLPAHTNVYFSSGSNSYVEKLIIPEDADILEISAADYSSSGIGCLEFPETAYIGSLLASITETEDIIIPEKVVFDEISLTSCTKTKLIELGKGVKKANIYDNEALEELIAKGDNLYLFVRDNPNLLRLEILSECSEVYVSGNTALEEITIHTSDPSKLTIDDSEDHPNTVTILRVPLDCADAYTAHFADIFPDMRVVEIKE